MSENMLDLMAKRDALDLEIKQLARQEKANKIEEIVRLMGQYSITLSDVQGRLKGQAQVTSETKAKIKIAPKYRNNTTGEVWTGRGKTPLWVQSVRNNGGSIEDYLIPKNHETHALS